MSEEKGYILIYDTVQVPDGMTKTEVFDLAKKGYCLYDSSKGDKESKPKVIHLDGEKNKELLNCNIIDVYEHSRKS